MRLFNIDTGRTVLLTWVCMLAVTHPLANFRNNLHVMSNSLVCTEVKVVNSTAKLVKLALAPINGLFCRSRVTQSVVGGGNGACPPGGADFRFLSPQALQTPAETAKPRPYMGPRPIYDVMVCLFTPQLTLLPDKGTCE